MTTNNRQGILRRMLVAAAATATGLLLLVLPAGNATASASLNAQTAKAAGCSTWQYWTDSGMPIYQYDGGTGRTTFGVVNVTNFSGDWRGGNFYWYDGNGTAVRYNSGWIHISHIHYRQCW